MDELPGSASWYMQCFSVFMQRGRDSSYSAISPCMAWMKWVGLGEFEFFFGDSRALMAALVVFT